MKKVKWIVLSLLICSGIALGLCYLIIPERTKCAIDIVVGYLNTPFGLGCGITITGGMIIFVFAKYLVRYALKNSKYGKAQLDKLESQAKAYEEKASEFEQKALKQDEIVKTYLSDFKSKVDYLCDFVKKVCETSPNAKIKALGNGLELSYNELETKLNKIDKDLSSYVSEKNDIAELEKSYKELLGKVEELYAKERETTIDNKAKEE